MTIAPPLAPLDRTVGPSSSTDPTPGDLWRSARGPLAVLLVVLVGGTLLALAAGSPGGTRLDPGSARPGGGRALATLLRHQGVTVDLVTTTAAVRRTARPGDTLLVVDPDLIAPSQVAAVRRTGADLVLLAPTDPARYAPGLTAHATSAGVRVPGCRLRAARRAGTADAGGIGYETTGPALRQVSACYARDGLPSLVRGRAAGQRVTVLGSAVALTNDRLDDAGDAALALGLLGEAPRLVWYLPSPDDVPAAARESFYSLVPDGVWWGLGQLAVAVLLLGLWRARRLGPVVAEPLPVVVRAAETVEGRARLYRRAGARGPAAEALRSGVRSRLEPALGLPRRAAPPAVVAAVAARSVRPAVEVGDLLYGAAPADDHALVRLADDLDALEREVRRP